jgi:hypothetical protein
MADGKQVTEQLREFVEAVQAKLERRELGHLVAKMLGT